MISNDLKTTWEYFSSIKFEMPDGQLIYPSNDAALEAIYAMTDIVNLRANPAKFHIGTLSINFDGDMCLPWTLSDDGKTLAEGKIVGEDVHDIAYHYAIITGAWALDGETLR